jgi:hypothetical protein
MSNSGGKMDVEDVLLSIRQLVSEESRVDSNTARTRRDPQNTDINMPEEGNAGERDRLALTSSTSVTESDKLAKVAADLERRMADIESFVMSDLRKNAQVPFAQPGSSQRTANTQKDETAERRDVPDTNSDPETPLTSPEPKSGASAGAAMFLEPIGQSDTESLRETILGIVRSELQGELGDRVTRNVRKLVHREIKRALASQNFE